MTWQGQISRQTSGHRDIHDITDELSRLVGESGVATGIAHLAVVGSTAAIGGIELEPGLARDLPEAMDRLLPPSRQYGIAFFSAFRDLTASGFWSSKMGVEDLQYKGNTFVAEWTAPPPEVLRKLGVE